MLSSREDKLVTCAWPGQTNNRQEDLRISFLPSVYLTRLCHIHIVARLEVFIFL